MLVENFFDLRIAHFFPGETVPEALLIQPDYDILRVHAPTTKQRAVLLPLGFIYRPSWLSWHRPVYSTINEYMASFNSKARNNLIRAIKRVEENCQLHVEFTLNPALIDKWLSLYQRRMTELPQGVDLATKERDKLLSQSENVVGVFLYHEGYLIAGAICSKEPQKSVLSIHYYASDSSFRHLSLSEYIYFITANVTRELGYRTLSAGSDPGFFGHGVSTGLFTFKKTRGFCAEPRRDELQPNNADILEKVISLVRCEDPSLSIGYADPTRMSDQLVGHVFSQQQDPPISSFSASFLQQIHCHYIPGSNH